MNPMLKGFMSFILFNMSFQNFKFCSSLLLQGLLRSSDNIILCFF